VSATRDTLDSAQRGTRPFLSTYLVIIHQGCTGAGHSEVLTKKVPCLCFGTVFCHFLACCGALMLTNSRIGGLLSSRSLVYYM
jgi:hypothetical protein